MDNESWNTKDDVLKDLMKVAGRAEVDESYIVRGCRPPPVHREQEDEEELMRQFGVNYRDRNMESTNDFVDPEEGLKGIAKMIRMVDEFENTSNRNAADDVCSAPGDTITISKRNRNVNDFVPKHTSTNESVSDHTSNTTNELLDPNLNNNDHLDNRPLTEKTENLANIDAKKLDEKEYEIITSNLRDKIKNASKVENKKEKNVAIVSLLKLYAARCSDGDERIHSSQGSNSNSKPLLLTPEYYKNSAINSHNNTNTHSSNNSKVSSEVPSTSNSMELPTTSSVELSTSSVELSTSSINRTRSRNESPRKSDDTESPRKIDNGSSSKLSTQSPKQSPVSYDSNAEITSSVEKVNNWLNPQTKKKNPLHLGPITFRKKAVSGHRSPNGPEGENMKVPRNDQYVPSQNARKLSEMYMKRVQEREDAEKRKNDIVTLENLNEKLRAKDEAIRKKIADNSMTRT